MKFARLYLLLVVGVLAAVGCGQDRSNSSPDAHQNETRSPSDTRPSRDTSDARTTATAPSLRVLVLGNSIAAGAGVGPAEAFPALLQRRIDSLGWQVTVQNAGVSGATTAGGLRRIGWLLNEPVDILILELGGNDGLRGVDLSATEKNLTSIIDTTLTTYPNARVLLAGMRIPPNLGPRYTEQFRQIYPTVANEYERVTLLPFVLQDVAGVDSLMQDDGIHPTAPGHRIVANNVWSKLRPMLEEMRENRKAAQGGTPR